MVGHQTNKQKSAHGVTASYSPSEGCTDVSVWRPELLGKSAHSGHDPFVGTFFTESRTKFCVSAVPKPGSELQHPTAASAANTARETSSGHITDQPRTRPSPIERRVTHPDNDSHVPPSDANTDGQYRDTDAG